MLSRRSGCTSLQPKIPKTEFENISSKMDEESKRKLAELYECDENYIDNHDQHYLLKIKNEFNYTDEQITEEDEKKIFDEKTEKLLGIITEVVEKHFDSTERVRYLSSSI